jgi:TolB protein
MRALRIWLGGAVAVCLLLTATTSVAASDRPLKRPLVFVRVHHCTSSACSWLIVAATRRDGDERILAGPYPRDAFDDHSIVNWAPDGRSVIYMANQAIWRVNVYGRRHLHKVFQPPAGTFFDDGPAFTPDGNHIVFTRCCPTGFGYSLWMIRADGTHLRDITTETGGAADTTPQVSPDGTRIAFNRCADTGGCAVTTVALWGHNRQVLTGPRMDTEEPRWSPNSRRLVFGVNSPAGPIVARIDADGSGYRRLTHASAQGVSFNAAFTAEGRIIFSHYPSLGGVDLFTMNQSGRNWLRVTHTRHADEFEPEWLLTRR